MESQGRADNSSCGGFDVGWIRDPIKRRETKTVKGNKRFSFAPSTIVYGPLIARNVIESKIERFTFHEERKENSRPTLSTDRRYFRWNTYVHVAER